MKVPEGKKENSLISVTNWVSPSLEAEGWSEHILVLKCTRVSLMLQKTQIMALKNDIN